MSEEVNKHYRIANFTTQEVTPEEVIEETPIVEELVDETPVIEQEEVIAELETETQVTEETIEPQKVKKKVNVQTKDFIEQNKDLIKSYLSEGTVDYSSIDDLEAVKLKLKKENPTWTKEDIEEEVKYKFSLDLKTEDVDLLTDEERARLKKGERELKSEAIKAKQYLESTKPDLSNLPEYEYEYEEELTATPVAVKSAEEYEQEVLQQMQEYKTNVWIPSITQTLNEQVSNITEEVDYEFNGSKGVIKVDYKLSEAEKKEVLENLAEYVSNPSDNKYVNQDGVVDYKGFVEDKTKEKFYTKLIKSAVKEAMSIASENVVKKHVVNFSEEVRSIEEPEHKVGVLDFLKHKNGK